MSKQYKIVGLGGTFDHFHVGHAHFLRFAAELGDEIWIGITTPELTKNKVLSNSIESEATRTKAVEKFCQKEHLSYRLFSLENPFGPTLQDTQVEAVAVTPDTVKGGENINLERQRLGLLPLPIHICSLLKDTGGEDLNSTRIRAGLVNPQGLSYKAFLDHDFSLSKTALSFFQKPQGKVVKQPSVGNILVFVVGDVVAETFVKEKSPFTVGVIDGKSKRQPFQSQFLPELFTIDTISNPAGMMSRETSRWIVEHFKRHHWYDHEPLTSLPEWLGVEGEEDLVAVALMLLAPLGTTIYYGQPDMGMIEMKVTLAKKELFRKALKRE